MTMVRNELIISLTLGYLQVGDDIFSCLDDEPLYINFENLGFISPEELSEWVLSHKDQIIALSKIVNEFLHLITKAIVRR